MPKPMLNNNQQTQSKNLLSASTKQVQKQQTQQIDKMKLDRMLRKPRSKEYMELIHKLDAGGHVHNQKQVDEIMDAIAAEFPEIEICGVLLGIVSKCYLGEDYEVHTVDLGGSIIEHYRRGRALPANFECARSLVIHGGYEAVEVYVDCCRAISSNGTVSVVHF